MIVKEKDVLMKLPNRILKETAVKLLLKVTDNAKYRRVKWKNYSNLKGWFLNWEHYLEELGFACRDDYGGLIIPKEQLQRILNVDEYCLSMDGIKGRRGGRPSAVFYLQNLPLSGRPTGKSGLTTTLITSSAASGEAIPPHFLF